MSNCLDCYYRGCSWSYNLCCACALWAKKGTVKSSWHLIAKECPYNKRKKSKALHNKYLGNVRFLIVHAADVTCGLKGQYENNSRPFAINEDLYKK